MIYRKRHVAHNELHAFCIFESFKDGTVRIVGKAEATVRHLHLVAHGVVLSFLYNTIHHPYRGNQFIGGSEYITFHIWDERPLCRIVPTALTVSPSCAEEI